MKRAFPTAALALFAVLLFRCEPVEVGGREDGGPVKTDTTPYACTGKTRCSEMKTCNEAIFHLKNCPGVEIDGDLDGLPCEEQLCGH